MRNWEFQICPSKTPRTLARVLAYWRCIIGGTRLPAAPWPCDQFPDVASLKRLGSSRARCELPQTLDDQVLTACMSTRQSRPPGSANLLAHATEAVNHGSYHAAGDDALRQLAAKLRRAWTSSLSIVIVRSAEPCPDLETVRPSHELRRREPLYSGPRSVLAREPHTSGRSRRELFSSERHE